MDPSASYQQTSQFGDQAPLEENAQDIEGAAPKITFSDLGIPRTNQIHDTVVGAVCV